MKRIAATALLVAMLALAGCPKSTTVTPPAPPPTNADHSITFTWTQTFADNSPCSTTVTTSCYTGFNEGYLAGTTLTQLHTDTTAVCTTATSANCTSTFNGTVAIGTVTFYVNATYLDQNGVAAVTSTPAEGSTAVTADSPTALNVVVH